MIEKNKIEKPFGPAATATGYALFIIGLVYTYFSLVGIILILFGAFIGFTMVSTYIDSDKRKVKFSNVLFGIIPVGKWIEIEDTMSAGIVRSRRGYRTYSRGMRVNDSVVRDLRIMLYDSKGKKLGPLKKFTKQDAADTEVGALCVKLGIGLLK